MAQNNIEPQADDTLNVVQPTMPDNEGESQSDDDTKSIQRKVGEITQYINSHKDEALAKYVVGMVNAIAGKYLTPEDKEKAINKLNKAVSQEPNPVPPTQPVPQQNQVPESVNVNENTNKVLNNNPKRLKDKIFKPNFKNN